METVGCGVQNLNLPYRRATSICALNCARIEILSTSFTVCEIKCTTRASLRWTQAYKPRQAQAQAYSPSRTCLTTYWQLLHGVSAESVCCFIAPEDVFV